MKRLMTLAISALLFGSLAFSEIPARLIPTSAEEAAMLAEADNFIDSLPDGMQDNQSTAIERALRGATGDLEKIRLSRSAKYQASPNIEVKEIRENGIQMRLYRPLNVSDELPLLVYFHGGGWCFGSLNSCAEFCAALAETGKMAVLAIDYSLAPENPFPKGMLDCIEGIKIAETSKEAWNISKISVGGDSAGANLALASALYLKSQNEPLPSSLVLIYPVLEINPEKNGSWRKFGRGYGLDRRLMDTFSEAYQSISEDKQNETDTLPDYYISPGNAPEELIRNLPPVLIINSERDILTDQGSRFASRLTAAGCQFDRIEFKGAVHMFATRAGQPTAFRRAVELTQWFVAGK